jgi:hypothetical protein
VGFSDQAATSIAQTVPKTILRDAAGFKEQDARKKAIAAKEAYKDAPRQFNYGI